MALQSATPYPRPDGVDGQQCVLVEQSIARGASDEQAAKAVGVPVPAVAEIRAALDRIARWETKL